MKLPQAFLDDLDLRELRQYAGEQFITGELADVWEHLGYYPVEVRMCASRGACDDRLYAICQSVAGSGRTLKAVRQYVVSQLYQIATDPDCNLLSVLFTGIYVGEPEDLLNHWRGSDDIFYPTTGLGKKIADIHFLGGYDTEDVVQQYMAKHFKDAP